MIKELLRAVEQAAYISKPDLARRLGQPLAMIEAGLSDLVRLGYLKLDEGLASCELPCGGCPSAKTCSQVSIKTLSVTEKGQHALEKIKDSS